MRLNNFIKNEIKNDVHYQNTPEIYRPIVIGLLKRGVLKPGDNYMLRIDQLVKVHDSFAAPMPPGYDESVNQLVDALLKFKKK